MLSKYKDKGTHQRDIGIKPVELPKAKIRIIGETILMKILDFNLKNTINIYYSILT